MAAWSAQGYIYNKAGTALVGITVNAYRIDTGALVGTTASVGATAGPPPKGAGYWIITGLDTTLEYRIEAIFSASQKVVRTRFNAEMGTLTVFDAIQLPVDTAIFINGSALNTVYAKLASPAFTGTVTMASNGLNVGSGQLQVTGGNVTMSGALTVGTNLTLSAGSATLPSNGLNVGSGQLQVTGGNVTMSGNLTVTGTLINTGAINTDSSGRVGFPTVDTNVQVIAITQNAARIALLARGAASQSADIFRVQNSTGNDFMSVTAAGNVLLRGPGAGISLAGLNDQDTGWHWFDGNSLTAYVGNGAVLDLLDTAGTKKMGFFGTSAIAKPTVTGAKGGNAALGSLLTALANLGLVTDSSSA